MYSFKQNILITKIVIIILVTFNVGILFAQPSSNPNRKILISVEAGSGVLFGNSNLSPWGVDYRNQYKNGFIGNIKAFYLFNKIGAVGLKYSYFTESGDYLLKDNSSFADNVSVHYIAPQIGFRKFINEKFIFGYAIGAGLAYYNDKGVHDGNEFKANSYSIAANCDLSFDYILFSNLAVGIDLSLMGCNKFKKINTGNENIKPDNWNRIKLLRADFSIGIKGYF